MTMSRFFRDYLYIPLGGSRCAKHRHLFNLLVTMTLVGLWHGAGWTFIVWGALHGAYLAIHRMYRWIMRDRIPDTGFYKFLSHALTFGAVVVGWVFFRAQDMDQALHIVGTMSGFIPSDHFYKGATKAVLYCVMGYAACLALPSSMAFFRLAAQERPLKIRFRPNLKTAIVAAITLFYSLMMLNRVSEFLYFQF